MDIPEAHRYASDSLVLTTPAHLPTCGGCVARGGAFACWRGVGVAGVASGRGGPVGGLRCLYRAGSPGVSCLKQPALRAGPHRVQVNGGGLPAHRARGVGVLAESRGVSWVE